MHRGSWEMEVYARDFQQRRWHEAAKRRLADEAARSVSRERGNPFALGIARLLATVAAWLSSDRTRHARRTNQEATAVASMQSKIVPERERPAPRALPYADMTIVARGPIGEVAEQPSGIRDC